MKMYINEIKENDHVDSLFLVKEKSSAVTKTGNNYLKLKLVDRSGEIEGRIWTSVENFAESFEKDGLVHVMGKKSEKKISSSLTLSIEAMFNWRCSWKETAFPSTWTKPSFSKDATKLSTEVQILPSISPERSTNFNLR